MRIIRRTPVSWFGRDECIITGQETELLSPAREGKRKERFRVYGTMIDLEGGTRPCIIPNKLLIVGWIVSRVFMKPLLEIPSNYFYVPFSGIRQCLTCVHEKWNKIVPRLARHWLLFALRWFVRLFVLKRTKDQIWTSKVLYFYFELGYLFYRST